MASSTEKPAATSRANSGRRSKPSPPRQRRSAKSKAPRAAQKTTALPPSPSAQTEPSPAAKPELSPNGYQLVNQSQLADIYDCDRATVRQYIRKHKIKPYREREKLKEYELTPALESILEEEIGSPKLGDVRLEDAHISKEIKRVKLEKSLGRLVEFDQACEYFTELLKGLHNRFAIQYAPVAGPRLHKLKSGREVSLALRRDFDKIFGEFRADPRRFVK